MFTKLCKFDGEKATLLSIRDFQQISGRAGRKGFDTQGTVVVQAPEHVIENLIIDQKAAADPKKAKNKVKRKPPEKGYIAWNQETLTKLSEGKPEALTSRFQVSHGMILNVLAREGTRNCDALRELISLSHESEVQKKRHGKLAFQLFRSLYERKIIELNPLRLNVNLQQDFSLNQSLSLYLIDALAVLNREDENYALDTLTLVESILENPDLILRRQVDRAKTEKMMELKASGMEFDQRIEELEKISYPKPNEEFIYTTFNAFAAAHPWIGQENIRPKSIAREMFETFQSFHEYIKSYDLERVEGLLLRYLSEVFKVLVQNVPDSAKNESVQELIEYFKTILKDIDSSLVEEWERMKNPVAAAINDTLRAEQDAAQARLELAQKQILISIRNEVFRGIRHLISGNYADAALVFAPNEIAEKTEYFAQKMTEYYETHEALLLDPKARAQHFTKLTRMGDERFKIEQTLSDPDGHNDWILVLEARASLADPHPQFQFIGFE